LPEFSRLISRLPAKSRRFHFLADQIFLADGRAIGPMSGVSAGIATMPIMPIRELVDRANRQVRVLQPVEAIEMQRGGSAVLVDVRDIRELDRDGRIAGALHAPRGMIEFWFEPTSPYYRDAFGNSAKTYILFCAAGWRSALAAKSLEDMGFENIAHVDGGFAALKRAGAEVETGAGRDSPRQPAGDKRI
jgi:rhodanese-related sulfurtransferase